MRLIKKWGLLCFLFSISHLSAKDTTWAVYANQTLLHQKTLPGWCTSEKALKLMNLIYDTHPEICVEIGVFGGSSVYPTARALSYVRKGIIYAIDPWTTDACVEGYTPNDPNAIWWSQLDLDKIFRDFKKMIEQNRLSSYCAIMRMTSKEALLYFGDDSIDILHIDGNHAEQSALADAEMFFPKVKAGGYIWFDDANWSSTNKAVQYLDERCTFDPFRSIGDSCLLFKKK